MFPTRIKNQTKSKRAPGFSLIELLIVMSLIVVFAGLVALSLDGVQRSQDIETCMNSFAVYFERSRQEAIKRQSYVALGIKQGENYNGDSQITLTAGVSDNRSSLSEDNQLNQILTTERFINVSFIDPSDLPEAMQNLATDEQLNGDYLDDVIRNDSIKIGRETFDRFLIISPGGAIIPDLTSHLYYPNTNISIKSTTSNNVGILTVFSIMGESDITLY